MTFNLEYWPYKDAKSADKLEPGNKVLYISAVTYMPAGGDKPTMDETLQVTMVDLEDEDEAEETFTWWLKVKDSDKVNTTSIGTLKTLGRALFDMDVCPSPNDLEGKIVFAEVKCINDRNKIYEFKRPTKAWAEFSDKPEGQLWL